jgi:hypothetical protein
VLLNFLFLYRAIGVCEERIDSAPNDFGNSKTGSALKLLKLFELGVGEEIGAASGRDHRGQTILVCSDHNPAQRRRQRKW